nr:EOG090X0C7N [Cyclestheria hislopi]
MSSSSENLQSVLENSEENAQFWRIIIALFVVFITTAIFLIWKSRKILRRGVLVVGLCDSGKTLLFSQLVYKKPRESFTSMQENTGDMAIQNKGSLKIIDIPGHERVRQRYLDTYKASARAVIFVIDSLTFSKDIRDVAEYLYTILTDPVISGNCPPFLIACNKQDYDLVKGQQVMKSQLEKEINVLRTTRLNQLQATSSTGSSTTFLGIEGKDFEFSHLHSIRVDFSEISAREGTLDPLIKWIHSVA